MYNTIEPRLIALLNDSSLEKRNSSSLNLPPLQRAQVSRRPSPLEPETSTNPGSQPTNRPSISRRISSTESPTNQDNGPANSLSGGGRLPGKTSSQSLQKILDDDDYQVDTRTSKRRSKLDSGNDEFVQLPQPAPKKQKATPQIVPPIIIGLFEPPPNAALFPPIASSSFHDSLGRNSLNTAPLTSPGKVTELQTVTRATRETENTQAEKKGKVQRRKWTEQETSHLLLGVHKHGVGKWKSILKDPEFCFDQRNAVDLKDRFRTCCPEEIRCKLTKASNHSIRRSRKKPEAKNMDDSNRAITTPDITWPISAEFDLSRFSRYKNQDMPATTTSDVTWPNPTAESNASGFTGQDMRVDYTSSRVTTESQPRQDGGAQKSRAHRKQLADLRKLGIYVPFRPSARRERRRFTEEEDRQILQGWERHGQAWTRILSDPEFKLQGRRPTDIRDRFRNRFPEKYAEAVPKNTSSARSPESNQWEVSDAQVDNRIMNTKTDFVPMYEPYPRQHFPQNQLERYNSAVAPNPQGGNMIEKFVPQYSMHSFKEAAPEPSFNIEMPLLWNDHINSIGEMDVQRFLLDESWPMSGSPTKQKQSFTDIESICAPVSGTSGGVTGPFGYDILEFRET